MNNEPKLNVDEHQDDIKHLKEQYDIHNEDEVQEITAAKKNHEKEKACVCDMLSKACNKNGLKKHIQEEHTELW